MAPIKGGKDPDGKYRTRYLPELLDGGGEQWWPTLLRRNCFGRKGRWDPDPIRPDADTSRGRSEAGRFAFALQKAKQSQDRVDQDDAALSIQYRARERFQ